MSDLFKIKETKYKLRNKSILFSTKAKTTSYGINSITYMGPKIWNFVPDEIKESKSLIVFKHKIKTWIPEKCPCTLCKVYVPNLGYLETN